MTIFWLGSTFNVNDLPNAWYSGSTTMFTFPHTLGALFFGLSLTAFYSTIKCISRSDLAAQRKIWAFIAVVLLFILGVIAHVFDVEEISMYANTWSTSPEDAGTLRISAYGDHMQFIPMLHGFIVIFTGWVAAHMLFLRAYILIGSVRWFKIMMTVLLTGTFLAQIVMYGVGFVASWPAYPLANLVLQIPITIAVVCSALKHSVDSKKNALCVIEDVLIDSGALLTVGLILQTVFPFAGVSFEPMNALLPHLQNFTACVVFSRLIEGQNVGGVLKLSSEESIKSPAPAQV